MNIQEMLPDMAEFGKLNMIGKMVSILFNKYFRNVKQNPGNYILCRKYTYSAFSFMGNLRPTGSY